MRTFLAVAAVGMLGFTVACGGTVGSEIEGAPSGSTSSTDGFDVTTLPGLSLWLQSDQGIAFDKEHTRVLGWHDQSPLHNDLTLKAGVGATRDGAFLGITPTVAFDGASSYAFPGGTPLDDWSGDFLIEVVMHAQYTTIASSQGLFSCVGPQPTVPGLTTAKFYISESQAASCDVESDGYSNVSATKPVLLPTGYVVSFERRGSVLTSRRNGVVDQTQYVNHVTTPHCTSAVFGALMDDTSTPSGFLASDVAEVIVSQGTSSDAVIGALESSLMTKYGITSSN
ncbi:MAG: hypothetical protein ABI183_26610 [Polyangiaceae bacterium]